jgi:hypothetical protein
MESLNVSEIQDGAGIEKEQEMEEEMEEAAE